MLTCILHEGGPGLASRAPETGHFAYRKGQRPRLQFVLFGFSPRWTLHLARSPSTHSYGYASSADPTNRFVERALNPEPFMQYAG